MNAKTLSRSLIAAAGLSACSAFAVPVIETPGFYLTTVGYTVTDVADAERQYTPDGYFIGLQNVSAIAFARNADVVFAVEKEGIIRVIVDGKTQDLPVLDMRDQVADHIDSGMGGVAVHPDFPEVAELLITYTHDTGVTAHDGTKYARVARVHLRGETGVDGELMYFADPPTEDDILVGKLTETPEFPSCNDRPVGADCGAVDFSAHSFTFVHYGPDEKIYVGTGDGAGYFRPEPHALYAQIDDHLSGKVLRINPDGSAPEDNPFFTGDKWDNASKVFAKGLRNPKSGSFDPATGKLCVGNVGWYLNEGIYCLSPGDNAGWPCRENGPAFNGYQSISLSRDGERIASCPLEPGTYIAPDYTYAHKIVDIGGELLPIGAVIGCARPTADEYPAYFQGSCVFGDYVFDTIESVRFGAQTTGNPSSSLILSGAGAPSDMTTDRDGRLCYVAYSAGRVDGRPVSEIRCLGYSNDGSVPLQPVPSFTSLADPADPSSIRFDASSSYHPGGADLSYSWDFGDGLTAGNEVSVDHVYQQFGEFEVTLTVSTAGTNISRTTFQLVNIPDPDFVTPVLPSVVNISYSDNDHELSSPVEFTARIRNDLGNEPFRVLANVYDDAGTEVAHLIHDELIAIAPGQFETVDFLWLQAGELGRHTVSIEFYSEDWVSWTLKYPNASTFFVRNRAAAGAGVAPEIEEDAPGTDGDADEQETADPEVTDEVVEDNASDVIDGTPGNTTDSTTDTEENSDAGDGTTIESEDTPAPSVVTPVDPVAPESAQPASPGDLLEDDNPGTAPPVATASDDESEGVTISSSNGCSILSPRDATDPLFGLLLLGASSLMFRRRLVRSRP